MKHYELWNAIIGSYDEYWHRIEQGPLYNYNLGMAGSDAVVAGWHDARAVMIDDIDIALEWGMSADPFDLRSNWHPDWAPFPDPSVSLCYADVFYRGALVERITMASVDGGRAYLPLPRRGDDDNWVVMDRPYQLARVISDIEGNRDFEDYFQRSGIYKWPA